MSVSICIAHKSYNALTLLVGQQEGHPVCKERGCWFVGGEDFFDQSFARLIAPVVSTTYIILCFNKHRLTQVHLKKGR